MFQRSLPTHRPTITARLPSKYRPKQRLRSLNVRTLKRIQRVKAAPEQVTGVVFEPFSEVQIELATVEKTDNALHSFARSDFAPECEAALNEQINVEYNISYVYHALSAYFDRDNVALPGLAEFFEHQSLEEREHAEKLMDYQNKRGGRVKLMGITSPRSEFYHKEKGDALYAMELSLSLEKLNFQKLRDLWGIADKHNDPALCDFLEGELLSEQVEDVKKVSEYVSQLRRVGTGHGVFHFDRVFRNGK